MLLDNFITNLNNSGQGPTVLGVGTEGFLYIFFNPLSYLFSFVSLREAVRYSLLIKKTSNQPTNTSIRSVHAPYIGLSPHIGSLYFIKTLTSCCIIF